MWAGGVAANLVQVLMGQRREKSDDKEHSIHSLTWNFGGKPLNMPVYGLCSEFTTEISIHDLVLFSQQPYQALPLLFACHRWENEGLSHYSAQYHSVIHSEGEAAELDSNCKLIGP